ncbi:uncharacterized protein LOC120536742 isoform X2 [Polypterus senegalus]|uniref:uncharacterized protein LOC120536742 isoform X2 n=1 Tax=Polypterus senegalus TaxID=55291 RepID=UPI0019639E1F|nr:uncharacterized protein LOC120536742 isoform X2 [Polypterus senegalus]XP_039621150.1 uncharacterized protein LOC120536742 isoform X2 [Polypterus senegalus]
MKQGSLWMMHLTLIPSLHLQSNLSSNNSELLILTCTALGFYPSRIILSWHHSLPGVPHTTSQEASRLVPDGTYSSSSTLQVNTSLWLPGTKIGCEATHTSMARPLKKYIRNSVEKINAVKKYWYSLAFLVFPVILGGIYLLLIFSRSSAATAFGHPTQDGNHKTFQPEPSECIHEEGKEMENELQYSTFFHKNLKKYASSQNENDFKCIYSDVKMKEGGLTECKQGVDYAVLDICETPNVITKKSL